MDKHLDSKRIVFMDNQIAKPAVFAISLIQGIVLTLLYRSVEQQLWPATELTWLMAGVTFTLAFPLLLLLSATTSNLASIIKYLLPYSLVLAALAAYVGLQQEPSEYVDNWPVLSAFIVTSIVASFKALMYIQQLVSGEKLSYDNLFRLSWRNFIIFVESWLFVAIFWGILHLGAGLFSVIEIKFFSELLRKDWFVIPILTLAFGFAVVIFRNISYTVDNISTILQTLIKFLLPALTIVSLGFLVTLPFTGLGTLWKTGSGSLLVMWLQTLTLFFVNAVYHQGYQQQPYNKYLHRLIFFGVALLSVYSVISLYGIWLRVDQYGLTVSRCWAILIWLLLASFSFGYLYGIVKKRDQWLTVLSTVNVFMGAVVLLAMLLVNSPLLNFQAITVKSQLKRLNQGITTYQDFDYRYFKSVLGRQGYFALQALKAELVDVHPEKAAIIERFYAQAKVNDEQYSLDQFKEQITFWPSQHTFDETLIDAVYQQETEYQYNQAHKNSYYFIAVDLNSDQQPENIVITENNYSTSANLWRLQKGNWQETYISIDNPDNNRYLKELITENDVAAQPAKWKKLTVGNLTFTITDQ